MFRSNRSNMTDPTDAINSALRILTMGAMVPPSQKELLQLPSDGD